MHGVRTVVMLDKRVVLTSSVSKVDPTASMRAVRPLSVNCSACELVWIWSRAGTGELRNPTLSAEDIFRFVRDAHPDPLLDAAKSIQNLSPPNFTDAAFKTFSVFMARIFAIPT